MTASASTEAKPKVIAFSTSDDSNILSKDKESATELTVLSQSLSLTGTNDVLKQMQIAITKLVENASKSPNDQDKEVKKWDLENITKSKDTDFPDLPTKINATNINRWYTDML